jgi:hypothetical protein
MKRIISFILAAAITLLIPCSAFAEGSGNMDGGGGGMEGGTGSNFWHAGEEGVRVTVVRAKDGKPVSIPVDLTNWNESSIKKHFGKKSKLHYRNGSTLSMKVLGYISTKPSKPLPKVISNGGNANIKAIKSYFTDELIIRYVASIIGASYDTLINGNYKLLIEPIAYFTFNGTKMAMTATEAALYDQKLSGGLRRKMVSLSHQNLPLSLFLEKSDLGYPAYHGSTSRAQSNSTIISCLGLGIVKFKDDGGEPPIITPGGGSTNSTYRVDTDVITSVSLSTYSEITPDSPAKVSFRINGSAYNVTNIVIPENESQLVWVKWHTPKKPQTVNISISSSKGSLSVNRISAKVESLDENPPPNPTAKDRNDRFIIPNIPKRTERTASSWGIWNAKWVPDWQWHEKWVWKENPDLPSGGKWVDKGKWVDEGEWEYKFKSYHASLKSNMKLLPDDKVPTAKGKLMRSGYGIKINVNSSIRSSAPTSHYTCGQTAVTYFPEFSYNTYWRLLDLKRDGDTSSFSFKNNIYSTYNRKVHFTPLWFPNKKYTAYTYLQDAWTPAGMLSMNLTDYVNIDGSVFDDWHVGPKLTE